jgi:excisionase family DNA binding protein
MATTVMLTAHEVADRLGMSVHRVYRRLERGDIPFVYGGRHGRQYLVDSDALEKYIDAGQPLGFPERNKSMLSASEVAALTGYSAETVRKLCYEGKMAYVRGSGRTGHLRIPREAVDAFLSEREAV